MVLYIYSEKVTCDGTDVCSVTSDIDQSIITMSCNPCNTTINNSSTNTNILSTDTISPELCNCHTVYALNGEYNRIIATVIWMLSPLAYTYTPIHLDTPRAMVGYDCPEKASPSQTLILGLGGGDMHTFLTHYYPCMGVTSVELTDTVIEAAVRYLDVQVCDIEDWSGGNITHDWDSFIHHPRMESARCNSRIIHGNALHVVERMAYATSSSSSWALQDSEDTPPPTPGNIPPADKPRLYQYIISDFYGIETTTWTAHKGMGVSNPNATGLMQSLTNLKTILDPDTGMIYICVFVFICVIVYMYIYVYVYLYISYCICRCGCTGWN